MQAQVDSLLSKLDFAADFRFRAEQDWNSQKSDGSFRDDRSRLRYRARVGVTYEDDWYEVGLRIRTGNPRKQQDPQLTLGDNFREFGTLPIALEKAYFKGEWSNFMFWLGKNSFPFVKSNELFWSDNVFPEGVALSKGFSFQSGVLDLLELKAGHFIISTSGKSFDQDAYFQGYQVYSSFAKKQVELFPSIYLFKNVPNIPDGADTFVLDYTILHLGSRVKLLDHPGISMELDLYQNIQDYGTLESIPEDFKDERSGWVLGLAYGGLKQKKDWFFKASYAWLQRYAAVDFLAQNDWARWDYSAFDSPDGRLTNLKGIELVASHSIHKNISLTTKYYFVEQLVPLGPALETGSRIRFDIDVRF
ncbi:putative porin [Flagellimonas flava]|uniref:Putative porin n=1 Tax=Flagellimonas flava TaxID=570519 RepID=A0A1M5ILX1_9FLAO|nr:putative porin [Allomuricauda flava]SHG28783.1 Putative porin [Allomuricauda flava]